MSSGVDSAPLAELSRVLALEKDPEMIREFLLSLLTGAEAAEISSRWTLVRLMKQGMSQRMISRELGLSLCKITRGSKELKKDNSPFDYMIDILQKSLNNHEKN